MLLALNLLSARRQEAEGSSQLDLVLFHCRGGLTNPVSTLTKLYALTRPGDVGGAGLAQLSSGCPMSGEPAPTGVTQLK
ncbi:MAG: hypothetical protein F6K31_13715 [Symploca sp. SIO2G7]|nr:hypothetical protein [Symploca sp. SIO2G7]